MFLEPSVQKTKTKTKTKTAIWRKSKSRIIDSSKLQAKTVTQN